MPPRKLSLLLSWTSGFTLNRTELWQQCRGGSQTSPPSNPQKRVLALSCCQPHGIAAHHIEPSFRNFWLPNQLVVWRACSLLGRYKKANVYPFSLFTKFNIKAPETANKKRPLPFYYNQLTFWRRQLAKHSVGVFVIIHDWSIRRSTFRPCEVRPLKG